ncbi:MAG: transposase [Verrucomicrobiaceae bacterium]
MRKARFLSPWKDDPKKPAIYHVLSRVVDRRFVLGDEEREHFKMLMRMQENFTGCRILSYCIMSNHFHILLEVPPTPPEALSDRDLLKRLDSLYSPTFVNDVARDLTKARESGDDARALEIRQPFLSRMHDLSQFMKNLLQRFSSWFNRMNGRKGTLWEDRFTSVIVESGTATRTIAAYIDLNPVRAGMVNDPADYRWSSYGEAVSGGKKARAGLVRALRAADWSKNLSRSWAQGGLSKEYRSLLLQAAVETFRQQPDGQTVKVRKGMTKERIEKELTRLESSKSDLAISKAVSCHIRYFAAGAIIGSKTFVNDTFQNSRHQFGPNRTTGARKPRGSLSNLAGTLFSARDLRINV